MLQTLFETHSNPNLLNASTFNKPIGDAFRYSLHNHNDFTELLLICKGELNVTIDGTSYHVGQGTLLCYNQSIWHEELSNISMPFEALYVSFSDLQMRNLPYNHLLDREISPAITLGSRFFQIEDRMREILKERKEAAGEYQFICNQLLKVLLAEIARITYYQNTTSRKDRITPVVITVKTYIHGHYTQPITLKELAEISYTSLYHLCRIFKNVTGKSPIQYLIDYRMEVAKHLLLHSSESISDIAERVGYSSATHFQNVFKKIIGVTPGQFRG